MKINLNLENDVEYNLLINPILDYFSILEKSTVKVVYNSFFRKYIEIRQRFGIYPVYIPELGYLLALEIVSPKLSKIFYELTSDFDSFYSEDKVICAKIHNFNKDTNRFVTYGNYKSLKLDKEYYRLYITNLINDLLCTPSIINGSTLISPNRWYVLESTHPKLNIHVRADINYNIGIIFLTKDGLKRYRKYNIWLNSKTNIFEVPAGFITFTKEGKVLYKKIFVHFLEEPIDIEIKNDKGEYFICYIWSLNDYQTNYSKFKTGNKININIIENLSLLVYSPYELIPFIFPDIVESSKFNNLIIEFEIKKEVINRIINRLSKFSSYQNQDLIKAFEETIEDKKKLFRISENEDKLTVEIVNPSIIPFLIKDFVSNKSPEKIRFLKKLVFEPEKAFEELKLTQNKSSSDIEWAKLKGFGKISRIRNEIYKQYLEIWRQATNLFYNQYVP